MNTTIIELENTKYIQIYLSEKEYGLKQTQETIEKYRKQKYKIAIFISGKQDYLKTLKKIINEEVEKESNVC